jgi:hypothetical protein
MWTQKWTAIRSKITLKWLDRERNLKLSIFVSHERLDSEGNINVDTNIKGIKVDMA